MPHRRYTETDLEEKILKKLKISEVGFSEYSVNVNKLAREKKGREIKDCYWLQSKQVDDSVHYLTIFERPAHAYNWPKDMLGLNLTLFLTG